MWWHISSISASGGQRMMDLKEFRASLIYIMNSKPAKATSETQYKDKGRRRRVGDGREKFTLEKYQRKSRRHGIQLTLRFSVNFSYFEKIQYLQVQTFKRQVR